MNIYGEEFYFPSFPEKEKFPGEIARVSLPLDKKN
jgi:hypothetical protein